MAGNETSPAYSRYEETVGHVFVRRPLRNFERSNKTIYISVKTSRTQKKLTQTLYSFISQLKALVCFRLFIKSVKKSVKNTYEAAAQSGNSTWLTYPSGADADAFGE